MQPIKTITVDTATIVCDGGGQLGHPKVTLALENGPAACPYCGQAYALRQGVKISHGH